ncbi:HNH endonuclease [Sinorhizobium medicae]|uniref:HNH endonuclease n=1 Tax=Sinorhizobium medicae TaxID=110321 RepID=UPI001297AA95|nr:HNH endonuclease signature motif containing protein [Sinorhizobium medicae]MQW00683.1 HNH endonuclease [Sinorhizobium medicae]
MARAFSKKIQGQAFLRCGGKCEKCQAHLKVGEGEYDHIVPYALSEDSTLSNCQVLCVPCHRGEGAKTSDDIKAIAKAKRNWLKHTGAWPKSKSKIQSRGFGRTRDI